MLEIAGLVMSGIGLLNDLTGTHRDLTSWTQENLPVDRDWLKLALQKGVLVGNEGEFLWSREESVATRELQGTHQVVVAFNNDRKVKYRIVRGDTVLMKRV